MTWQTVHQLVDQAKGALKEGPIVEAQVLATLALAEALSDVCLELRQHATAMRQAAHSIPSSMRMRY